MANGASYVRDFFSSYYVMYCYRFGRKGAGGTFERQQCDIFIINLPEPKAHRVSL